MKTSHYASNDFTGRPAVLGSGIANFSSTNPSTSNNFDATIPFRPQNQQQSNIYDLNYQPGAPNFQPKHLQSTSSQTSSVTHQESASNTTYGSKSRESGASTALDGPEDYQVIKSTNNHKFQQQEHQHNKKRKRETGWFIIYSYFLHLFCSLNLFTYIKFSCKKNKNNNMKFFQYIIIMCFVVFLVGSLK